MTNKRNFTALDHQYMSLALQLAAKGLYTTSPNPRVGCVLVKDNQVVGQGAHLKAGEAHAEVLALQQAGEQAQDATAYVTLEPCSHHGRTPPCAEALLQAGISKVIVAMQDPNPLVAGRGLQLLADNGVDVADGLMQAQAEQLNLGFIKRMSQQKPYVRVKIASTLDGKTALANGESQWITGEDARQDVQRWRAQSCAMLTGVGTVLADNPRLNVRIASSRQPMIVIVDSKLQTPLEAKVLGSKNVWIAYAIDPNQQAAPLKQAGANLIQLPNADGSVDLPALLAHLASLEINEVLVEAGATLAGALLDAQCVDELILYYAPKLMGNDARGMLATQALTSMSAVMDLHIADLKTIGKDIRIIAKPKPRYAD